MNRLRDKQTAYNFTIRSFSKSILTGRSFLVGSILVALLSLLMITTQGFSSHNLTSSSLDPMPHRAAAVKLRSLSNQGNYVNIPYFTESSGMSSILTLNNGMPEISIVTVTIFNKQGSPHIAPPITLQPHTAIRVPLKKLIENASGDFHSGSVQVFYEGPSMAVTCQVSIFSDRHRLSFESIETSVMEFESSRLDGIIWTPDAGTRASLALTNTQSTELTVSLTSSQSLEKKSRALTLGPREMRLLDLKEFVDRKTKHSTSALLSLEHDGVPGSLIVTGFAINEATGFSCNLPFVDRSTAKSNRLAGAHVRFGQANLQDGFSQGTRFLAPLVVANAGEFPTKARIFVDFTLDAKAERVELGKINLAAGQVKQIDLLKELAQRGVLGPVEEAGVEVEYSGEVGTVLGRLTSMDTSGDLSFEVPIKDPLAGKMRGSGCHPWRLDEGNTTVVHLKNTLDKEVYALVQVRYEGGSYNLERLKMAAYQTVAVDIRKLRDAQELDIRETVMPKEVESGQVVWFEEEVGSLIGRAEVANLEAGVAASFSCPDPCQCPPSYNSSSLSPSSSVGPAGGTAQFTSQEMRRDCNLVSYGPYNRTLSSTWSSDNTSVMTVSGGLVSCLSPGTANVMAQFSATIYGLNCFPHTVNPATSGQVTVNPKVTSLSIPRRPRGATYDVEITGAGFAQGATVSFNPSTGISIDGPITVNSATKITAGFNIAADATGGNRQVIVTVGGRSSTDNVNFFVQLPTRVMEDSISSTTTCDPTLCEINGQPNKCGAYRTLTYKVLDQEGQVVEEEGTVTETVTQWSDDSLVGTDTEDVNANGIFADLVAMTGANSNCPSNGSSADFRQKFSVRINNIDYELTTRRRIQMQKSSGAYTIDVTTTTQ